MRKIVRSRFTSVALTTLLLLSLSFQSFGSHHEEVKDEAEIEVSTEGLQNEEWKEAPAPQGLESKRYSPYALDAQLDNQINTEESGPSETIFYILLTLIVLLLLGVLATAGKLVKGLARLSGKEEQEPDFNTINARLMIGFLVIFFLGILYEVSIHSEYILPDAASEHGEDIDNMMWITMGITGFVFVVTQILLFVFPFIYRQKKGQKALYYPHNDKLEIIWTTIPAIALTVLVLFGFRVWVNTTMTNPENSQYEIELYAYQFGWKIRYPGPDGKLGRADYRLLNFDPEKGPINEVGIDPDDEAAQDDIISTELVLPKEAMVQLKMRSRDVLHAAHLPHFRAQMYCVPGTPTQFTLKPLYTTEEFRNKINKPEFNFELACNQICGSSHFNMRKEILVVEEAEYNAWMKGQKALFSDNSQTVDKQLTLQEK